MSEYHLEGKRVWVAGHRGMVGSALVRALSARGIVAMTVDRNDLDLRKQEQVDRWMQRERPQAIFLAAAKVGGILANASRPAEFLYDNLVIETNIMEAARQNGAEKLLFLGSTCIYPKYAPQPINEDALLTGALEPTNEWYAIAKIAGLKLAEAYRRQYDCDFISAMPTNLYGPHDNFDLQNSHVLPALMRRIHEAKLSGAPSVVLWGSGSPRREFLHVDDLAAALLFLMERYSDGKHINVGTGTDLTILELAAEIADAVGYSGQFELDRTKPDGTPRKLTDVGRLHSLGWNAQISLKDGLAQTYRWFLENRGELRTV